MAVASTAPVIKYRDEWIAKFEVTQTLLRDTVTTEFMQNGYQATFLVAGSEGATAKTRGTNALIPVTPDQNEQFVATMTEWHDLREKTGFNIFQSQSNQRAIMQRNGISVLNRKVDDIILTELDTTTVYWNTGGAAITASVDQVMKAKTILGVNGIPWDSNIYAVITPAFEAQLMKTKEFASREYVNRAPMEGADAAWRDRPLMYYWIGVNWIVHPSLSGVGTATAKCFMWHKNAIGHAIDINGMDIDAGYESKQQLSWSRASCYMAAKALQGSGIVEMTHDDSGYAAG